MLTKRFQKEVRSINNVWIVIKCDVLGDLSTLFSKVIDHKSLV